MELYRHPHMRLQGVVRNYINTGKTNLNMRNNNNNNNNDNNNNDHYNNPWIRPLLEKLSYSKIYQLLWNPNVRLPCWQEPATGTYPD
jgi:hypothetical protein